MPLKGGRYGDVEGNRKRITAKLNAFTCGTF
jgi:hypothetical protein